MINSKQKGKRGELAWCRKCAEYGYHVRRTSQYCGQTGDAADCVGLPGIHQEVKWVERLNIRDAMDQAKHDAETAGRAGSRENPPKKTSPKPCSTWNGCGRQSGEKRSIRIRIPHRNRRNRGRRASAPFEEPDA